MVRFGMPAWEAIRAGTVGAADLLGRDDVGRIAPGAVADMVAVADDPLAHPDTLERPAFVAKGGRVAVGGVG